MPRPIMAGLRAIQDPVLAFERASTSLSAFLNINPPCPDAVVEGTKNFFCRAYEASKFLVPSLASTDLASGITTTELHELEAGVNTPELANTTQESEDDPFHDRENLEDVRQPAIGAQQGPMEALSPRPYHAVMWMAARFIGPLSLIVVPGLLLSIVTGQLPWGLALCGLIATVLGFFVSLHK